MTVKQCHLAHDSTMPPEDPPDDPEPVCGLCKHYLDGDCGANLPMWVRCDAFANVVYPSKEASECECYLLDAARVCVEQELGGVEP